MSRSTEDDINLYCLLASSEAEESRRRARGSRSAYERDVQSFRACITALNQPENRLTTSEYENDHQHPNSSPHKTGISPVINHESSCGRDTVLPDHNRPPQKHIAPEDDFNEPPHSSLFGNGAVLVILLVTTLALNSGLEGCLTMLLFFASCMPPFC